MKLIIRIMMGGLAVAGLIWAVSLVLVLLAGARPVLRHADAIIVLGAAQYDGRPSPVFKARIDHALALYKAHYAPRLIFTGGMGVGDTVSEGEVGRQYALQRGVPDSAILVDRASKTSAQSISVAASLMRDHGMERALLVSDSYHMLRLALLARRAGITAFRAPTPSGPIDRSASVRRKYVLRESVLFPVTAILGAF